MNRRAAALLIALCFTSGAPAALAGEAYFKTPSANIHCGYFDGDGAPVIRCDIRSFAPSTGRRPADCEQEWGDAFEVSADGGRGVIVCHGDTVISPGARTLGYGKTFSAGGISCTSEKSGLACKNRTGHGFKLSKKRQSVF